MVCCSHRSDHQSNSTSTLRSISCHILVNNLHFITYSTRIIQKKKNLKKIQMELSSTVFKNNSVILHAQCACFSFWVLSPTLFTTFLSRIVDFFFVWFINKFDLSWQLRPTEFEDIFKLKFDSISHPLPLLLIVVRPFIAPPKVHSYIGWRSNLQSGLIFFLGSQVAVKNSTQSEELNVTCGIPQGTVLGLCLFSLYTSVMPEAVTSGNLYLYADDTTVRCIASTVD